MESPYKVDFKVNLQARAALCSLYLPGAPSLNLCQRRLGWPKVVAALTSRGAGDPAMALSQVGLWQEASLLADPALVDWGFAQAMQALTVLDEAYPPLWRSKLGAAAPPCLAMRGSLTRMDGPWVGVVGSREPDHFAADLAFECGRRLVLEGAVLVSGGARGVDRLAVQGALSVGGPVVEILPGGLGFQRPSGDQVALSVAADGAEFSSAGAKQRNTLVYAGSIATLVLGPQYKVGGTWTGAVEALRRRLTAVVVPSSYAESRYAVAYQVLINLGAKPFEEAGSLLGQLQHLASSQIPAQPGLFGFDEVREPRIAYSA